MTYSWRAQSARAEGGCDSDINRAESTNERQKKKNSENCVWNSEIISFNQKPRDRHRMRALNCTYLTMREESMAEHGEGLGMVRHAARADGARDETAPDSGNFSSTGE